MLLLRQRLLNLGVGLHDPASGEEVARCESVLGECLHNDLLFILGEVTNGIDGIGLYALDLLWDATEVSARNVDMRTLATETGYYMPFESLQFFGDHQGNGDLVGLPTLAEPSSSVFLWNHENDSRTWIAPDIPTYIEWFAADRIRT